MKKILISVIACSCLCFGFASADEVAKDNENIEMSIIQPSDDEKTGKEILPPEAVTDSDKPADVKQRKGKWKDFEKNMDKQNFKRPSPDAKDQNVEKPNRPEKKTDKDFSQKPNRPKKDMNKDSSKRPNRPDFKNGKHKCKKDCNCKDQIKSKDKKRKPSNDKDWKTNKKNSKNHNMPVVRKNNKR